MPMVFKQKGKDMHPVSSSSELVSGTAEQSSEKKILIVDDEPFILKSLTFVLRKEGFQVDSATNGMEAKEKIQAQKPNIVFLDIMMPKMNGLEVCQWLREDPVLKGTYASILSRYWTKFRFSTTVSRVSGSATSTMWAALSVFLCL